MIPLEQAVLDVMNWLVPVLLILCPILAGAVFRGTWKKKVARAAWSLLVVLVCSVVIIDVARIDLSARLMRERSRAYRRATSSGQTVPTTSE